MTDALPLDPVIHAEARLRVMTTLAALGPWLDWAYATLRT